MSITVDSGANFVAFARVVFTFDPTLGRLTSEILTTPQLSTIVEKTSMVNANSTGMVVIVVASSPSDSPPVGLFELANFSLDSNTSFSGITTNLTFDSFDSQIVDRNGPQLTANYLDATIYIEGAPTPTDIGGACNRGDLGNLDCSIDGCVDTADFEIFRQAFGLDVGSIVVPPGQHTPDLSLDFSSVIDTADYEVFRSNFGTCQ